MDIHWHRTNWLNETEKGEIESRIRALSQQGREDLIDVRISGKPSRHRGHDVHEVRITCEARGREIVAVSTGGEMERCLHDALGTFKREVRRMREKRRDRRGKRSATAFEETVVRPEEDSTP